VAREKQYEVRLERNVLIPLSDGVSLAGDLFLPDAAGPFPAVVSYYPYRKDDIIGAHFYQANSYLAERGYASLLVDFRGLGGSEGVFWEEFDAREGSDGAEIVEWAAGQPWCDGEVGVWGMSYGGTTALQMAAARPPHLRAALAMNGNIDLYHELVYPGGCLCPIEELGTWGPSMIASSLLPPLHQDPEGRWYGVWLERLATLPRPMVFPFQEHPAHDEWWQSKVVEVGRIEVPTFLVTAWRDQCPEYMVEVYERVTGPRRLLVGPWGHWMPDRAAFAQVDYLAEMVRWWDTWLKGEETGMADEPPVTIYVQGAGWRHEREWPIARTEMQAHYLAEGAALVAGAPAGEGSITYRGDPTVGVTAGVFPADTGMGLPLDQGPDDRRSITFTGEPLGADLEITGRPEVTLHVALDEGDEVHLVVKLCDVSPDGASALITSGWLKGSHRLSHEHPEPLPAGEVLAFTIRPSATSYRIPQGHRLRLSVACADFPRIFPTPENPLIRLEFGGSHPAVLRLPVVSPGGVPGPALPVPDPAVNRTPLNIEGAPRYTIEHDFATRTLTVSIGGRGTLVTPERDGHLETDTLGRAVVQADRPAAARVEGRSVITVRTPSGSLVVAEGHTWVTLSGQVMSGRVTVDGQLLFEKQWRR
jgi:hypothetical protein